MTEHSSKLTFFRQSGWMMIATTLGGVFMWLVHKPAAAGMSEGQYGVFGTMLQVMNLMMIPAIGLQTVFANEVAGAVTSERQRELSALVRWGLGAMTLVWLMLAIVVLGFQGPLLDYWKIDQPVLLWITLLIGLAMVWWPILQGVLQGEQDFLWLGWLQVFNGMGRFAMVLVLVTLLGWQAVGAVTAALIGFWACVWIALWQTRKVVFGPGTTVDWRGWMRRVIPLSLGLGASQFVMAADLLVVKGVWPEEVVGYYAAPGMLGRALVFFTVPLVAVMFPKVVRSTKLAQDTRVMLLALGATALMGGAAAVACTLFPELPLRIIYKAEYLRVAPLVPWFAWAMLPLTLANVLVGNLLARGRFTAVPWLVVVALGYGATLVLRVPALKAAEQEAAFRMVIQTLGGFSLLLLAVAAWFTWIRPGRLPAPPTAQSGRQTGKEP
jgi:O-antigen/teichoic acid export membrane protein